MRFRRPPIGNLSADFWKYFVGQFISTFGTSFTQFAIPLLIYKLTGSAVNLGLATAASMLPYLLFGLVIGAWVDRLDRKRLMIIVNVLLAAVMASIPAMSYLGHLSVWYIYGAEFAGSTLGIFFNSAEFAAIPSLVGKDDLVTANGRIQASYSAAMVAGPPLAGVVVAFAPLQTVLLVDAASFLVAAFTLTLVRGSFNVADPRERRSIRQDIVEGLRYVLSHPVLRNISIMMALVNFISIPVQSQLVLFAKQQLHAPNSQIGLLYGAGSVGIIVLSLAAGPLRKRWSFSRVALTALAGAGVLTVALAFTSWVALAVPILALSEGLGMLFNINTGSLRQAIVPNHLLGRVMSIATVLAWSAIPLGAVSGGFAVQQTHSVSLVFAVIGVFTCVIPVGFAFTALGHADRYLPTPEPEDNTVAAGA